MRNEYADIDKANTEFWNELCGSWLAKKLGIKDHSIESLRRFDQAYLDYYPYLLGHVRPERMSGKKVLEIGLGYGTLGQKITESGADYTGLDIAEGPVNMMNHRLQMQELMGKAIQGSMLDCPLESESVDYIVSIGCFHHTGYVQRCINETHRILKPGGTAVLMMYNRFSYRQWKSWPVKTFLALLRDTGLYGGKIKVNEAQRKGYDKSDSGTGAPETEFLSINELRKMLSQFSKIEFQKENCEGIRLLGFTIIPRTVFLSSVGRKMGLDIYIKVVK
jgi:2-polyprenyl-3-methyl-5-hydroxy-6-metoxy-1,4-benzoquinol methylase